MIRISYRSAYRFVSFVFCILNIYAIPVCFSVEPRGPLAETHIEGRLSQLLNLVQTYPHGIPACVAFYMPTNKAETSLPFTFEQRDEKGQRASRVILKDDIKNGPYLEWHPNGNPKSEAFYVNGQYHGIFREWFENKQLKHIAYYFQGKLHGTEEVFSSNGVRTRMTNYSDGQIDGEDLGWYEDNSPKYKGSYQKGKRINTYLEYYQKTNQDTTLPLAKKLHYVDGKLHGEQKSYYPDGAKQATISHENGILNGKKAHWAPNGMLIEEVYFNKGENTL